MSVDMAEYITEYERELERQQDPYKVWIENHEGTALIKKDSGEYEAAVIFFGRDGVLAEKINETILQYFKEHPGDSFVYADEDVLQDGRRIDPWFKPEFSPDSIESVNYFGNIFAVRKKVLLELMSSNYFKDDNRVEFIKKANINADTGLISRIPFGEADYEAYWMMIRSLCLKYAGGHIDRVLYHGNKEENITNNIVHSIEQPEEKTLLSIIIPSKDNVDMLEACIKSIKKNATINYEIVVVDNGSSEDNKIKLEAMAEKYSFNYVYMTIDFNFSWMCNMGAQCALGDCFLFLNDDITVQTRGFDRIMAGQAMKERTGAVGAKLYYPDSTVIQHTGITNMGVGPAHKLAGIDDKGNESIYHARNLADWNVYAVTAAALCVSKEKYTLVRGFDETLKVAYNDVKFCFDLYDKGFYNLIRNDVIMYHHESVTRGTDESPEKKKRLKRERDLLYRRHPESIAKDPFYSKNLVQFRYDGEYNINCIYPYEIYTDHSTVDYLENVEDNSHSVFRKIMRKGPVCQFNIDRVLGIESDVVNLKNPSDKYKSDTGVISIEGWAGLTDLPQCCYERFLLLTAVTGENYKISMFDWYRPDAAAVMPNQKYNMLMGFTCHIKSGTVPQGSYKAGVMFTNRLNGKTVVYYNEEQDNSVIIEDV